MENNKYKEAIEQIKYRIYTASKAVGRGVDGKAYEDLEMAIDALEEVQKYHKIGSPQNVQSLNQKLL